jgi:hypothetical protein
MVMLSSFEDMVLSHASKFGSNIEHELQSFNTTMQLNVIVMQIEMWSA